MSDFRPAALRVRPFAFRFVAAAFVLAVLSCVAPGQSAWAQVQFSGQPTPEQIEQMKEMRRKMRGRKNAQNPPSESKAEEKKPGDEDKKKDEGDKKEEGIKTIKRPTDGSGKLDPSRMRLEPDQNGLVQFNYNGHPWADVLQEFADAAKFSFDWQELPADSLNLVTQKKYTLVEARDLLNRHLLARGFTMVLLGEELRAVKVEKLDPSLIPRVDADLLEDYPPHDFVRVLFQLPRSMDPNKAKEDVKILTSPNAKITPLLATKRLLVIDAVANLRSVRDLLYAEQSAADSIIKPEVYAIQHRRADYVADQIMIVLGLDPASRKTPQELQLETQRMQLLMQMQKKNKDVSKMLNKSGPVVHIAVDRQQNTLMVNAPAEFLPTIERTIKQVDQPRGSGVVGDASGRSTMPHKTTTASTDAVVSALNEFGQLDPLTRLQSDAKTKTIFAYATEADHEKIEQMIKKIDSTGREIHVIQLRRYAASQVAGTLSEMFGGQPKKEDNSRRRFSFWGMPAKEEKKEEMGFKAMADVENNRLIVWANDDEIGRVNKMLTRLGESPEGGRQDQRTVRELPGRSPEETAKLLERLKAMYPGKLNIDDSANQKEVEEPKEKATEDDKVTQHSPLGSGLFRTAQIETPQGPAAEASDEEAAAINITVTDDGRIVIRSDDPSALNELEDLVGAIEPPRKEYDYFRLENVRADRVVEKLEEYFAEELKGQTERAYDIWGYPRGQKQKNLGPSSLGRRELLRFVYDLYTNTVIVQGASAGQLAVIEQLIELYDEPPEPKNYLTRKTEVIELKYSRAQTIANSLKEVYRELLSSKDKEFADKEGGRISLFGDERTYVFGKPLLDEDGKETSAYIKFDGMLSVGVDAVSNSLIVSAREEVLESVKETVKLLDVAAKPDTMIHIHRVGGTLSAEKMQEALKSSLSQPWPGGKPEQAAAKGQAQAKGQQQPKNQPENNERRRRGGR